ncbi:hypothetical protein BDW02DRAFT_501978 [Decorospora gaudefroyi]|uniref:Uncharacterized protein n=1 Tax=Decorospora gaudefroyi TaxID=184978 RepID=A0A6A5KEL1_9PLEO|nr:hypothetical protein BDW02DRAFT_501978 [Decorospora gaudefroyi]
MGKPGLGLFTARRKSQGTVFDEVDISTSPDTTSVPADSGGFRLLSRTEVEKAKQERKTQEKERSSKFPRFTGFTNGGNKNRNQSFDDDSLVSSKRDSKSSNGTQFSTSRPYANGQHGSTSTLPSSTDTSSDDNLFANIPRPAISQHNSSPASQSASAIRKQLPALPKSSSAVSSYKDLSGSGWTGRSRAMTTSSYASTAVPPKLEADLNFGGFEDDMFSHLSRKESPELPRETAGRSLLSEKRTFQAEPIRIHPQRDIEPPLKSWESRGSADNLMASPRSDNDSPPPPPPPHKYSSYAPIASESPTLQSPPTFEHSDAHFVSTSFMERKPFGKNSVEPQTNSISSSSANSYETPYTSRSATASSTTTNTTPKAAVIPTASPYTDADEDDLFAPAKSAPKSEAPATRKVIASKVENKSPSAPSRPSGGRVMSQAEFREYQKRRMTQPPAEESSDEEDYEDEEEAIRKREEEEVMRRKNQQMHFAREAMRRSTTASGNLESAPDGMGFPSETSMNAEEWEDEDVPLGILAQHGFPSQARNKFPSQPTNAMPSYIPDRPASVGAMSQRASQMNLPAFARHLPQDPYGSSFIGGGLVRPTNRESMGFNGLAHGSGSVAGDSIAGGMPQQMMYQEAGMSQPSLVDQIQMRDMTKQKYMGGASAKKPQGGPFTGVLGQQMNANGQAQNSTRMSQMPMMNNMNPMNMMGGQMPMMGMNQMGYPVPQGNDYMQQMQQFQQMQQMIAMQQMQLQMMQQQPQQQDPRMSMALPNGYAGSTMGGGSFLNVPNGQGRPMSFMSTSGNRPQQRAMSYVGPSAGYTPSIAPSERSNIGLSARYRPVVNHSDATSNGTSMTLQASGGANTARPGVIKGILKKSSPGPQMNVGDVDDADEDWSRMAARKNKNAKGKENQNLGLEDLTRGLNI